VNGKDFDRSDTMLPKNGPMRVTAFRRQVVFLLQAGHAQLRKMFAAGWSACFEGAMGIAARRMRVKLPAETSIDAEVDLCHGEDGYSLRARLKVSLPGLEREVARELTESAHQTCPYSKAVHGNIYVEINLV
jgi:Ohr subfamily peroxiredoxin